MLVAIALKDGMIITPSGCSAETLAPDSLVQMTLDGDARGDTTPSSEWAMHAAIYRAYPSAKCIVHTHADACTALACLNEALPAFHYMIANFGGDDVRCAPYVTFGTPELAQLAVQSLAGRTACLLANHGMIVHAATHDRALSGLQSCCWKTLCRRIPSGAWPPQGSSSACSPPTRDARAARERFPHLRPVRHCHGAQAGKSQSS